MNHPPQSPRSPLPSRQQPDAPRFEEPEDAVIVGGGPAGLSAALLLGRSLRRTVVIDEGKPRNAVAKASHGFLTRDGAHPLDMRSIAHDQLRQYDTVRIIRDTATGADVLADGTFVVATHGGLQLRARKLIVATGMQDRLPPLPGLREVYGRSVFVCPYCDGWEHRGEPAAVFGNKPTLLHTVQMVRHWHPDVIAFTNGPAAIEPEERRQLDDRGIRIVEEPIIALQSNDGTLREVLLASGEPIPRSCGYLLDTGAHATLELPDRLGLARTASGGYEAAHNGETPIRGLYIIGDARNTFTGVAGSVAEGYEAARSVNGELLAESW